jgi:hypothetical protein
MDDRRPPLPPTRQRTVRRSGLRSLPLRAFPAVGALALAGIVLAGCSNGASTLARQACAHVDRSLADYHQALPSTGATAERDGRAALAQLEDALPLAAAATSDNGAWNALQTTLQQASRTSEGNLVEALRRQCAALTPSSTTTTATRPTTTTS